MFKRKKDAGRETEPTRILSLKQCCDMLLAAGYFRARIQALSPFDKVVGGIVWSITASGVEAGVDILFQENSTIGERIKLCEMLVRALVHMKCPLPLQSHQIQGLDYENLLPVLRWLIKMVMETRRLTGDLIRLLSVSQFDQEYEFPEEELPDEATSYIDAVGTRYQPSRKFKKLANVQFETVAQRTEATLLEYGEKMFGAVVYDEERQDRKREREEQRSRGKSTKKSEGADEAEQEAVRRAVEEEEKRLEVMLRQQMSQEGAEVKVSGGGVGNIITMQADKIRLAAEDYNEEMKKQALEVEAEADGEGAKRSQLQAFERQKGALQKKIKAEEAKQDKRAGVFETLATKVTELRTQVSKKEAYHARIIAETEKLDEVEKNTANKDVLEQLKALVFLNESLKLQEKRFKESCQSQLKQLSALMKDLEVGADDEEVQRMLEVEKIYAADLSKLQKLRQVLAKKNQEIAKITRAIDDIPTRAELLQYERRFIELYELVQDKLVETRKYYEFYNTLNENFQYMTNEDNLLNSIIEGFPKAMKSSQKGKDSFLASFSGILDNVTGNKQNVAKELQGEEEMRDILTQKYTKLLEKQRKYFKAVKEFQEECYKNEKLTDSLARVS